MTGTLSLVPATDAEKRDWSEALEDRFAMLLPLGRPGLITPEQSRAALRRTLAEAPGPDIRWVQDADRRVGHVWLSPSPDDWVVRDVCLDDPQVAADVLDLVRAEATAADADALEAWATTGEASQEAFLSAGDFTTTATKMTLPFDGPQPASDTVTLRAMTQAEYDAAEEADLEHYIAERARNGESEEVARRTAVQQTAELLPDGLATPGQHFWVGESAGHRVGTIWLDLRREYAFVYNVVVDEDQRGRGHGRGLMRAGAAAAQQAGAAGMGLNVFGDNVTARRLYDSLGYTVTEVGGRMPL